VIDYLLQYALFLAEAVTIVVAILLVANGLALLIRQARGQSRESLEVKNVNERFEHMGERLYEALLNKTELKARAKEHKQKQKAEKKAAKAGQRTLKSRLFVLDFEGDVRASAVDNLLEELSAVLQVARPEDEVVVRLESPVGMVHGYGLAASQLVRLKQRNIKLTVAVDKVAASGGYMMACVAERIVSAPFAIIGSIGVVGQVPNFNRWLKERNIDFELHTAGDHKRTLTLFGENTDAARDKFNEELEETHNLFKRFVAEHRPKLDIETVSTGEHWYGTQALNLGLVDEIQTSDDYILQAFEGRDIFEVHHRKRKTALERLPGNVTKLAVRLMNRA
jgi:serine protease SohB